MARDLLFDFIDILCGRWHLLIKEFPNDCIALFHLQQEILTRYTRLLGRVLSEEGFWPRQHLSGILNSLNLPAFYRLLSLAPEVSEVGSRGFLDLFQVDVEILKSQFPYFEVTAIRL